MIVKGVILFLIFIAVIAMFGKLGLVWGWIRGPRCNECGKSRTGKSACTCKKRN